MSVRSRVRKFAALWVVISAGCLIFCGWGGMASAMLYGRGNYGSCTYQVCSTPQPTVNTTPTGLEVSINLTNGQKIPQNGYSIVMTPLNGEGSSFAQAMIYVNGVLVQTVKPDETGTVRWLWRPGRVGSTKVKIIIQDTDGSSLPQSFNLQVVGVAVSGNLDATSQRQSTGQGLVQGITNRGVEIVKRLPAPVVQSFPFVLFILLAVDAGLLLLQAIRELQEYRRLKLILKREQILNGAKDSFLKLVSHYFRTPVTILRGGVDLAVKDSRTDSALGSKLSATSERIRTTMESLVSRAHTEVDKVTVGDTVAPTRALWLEMGPLVPVGFVAIIWLCFEYLLSRAGKFSVGQVEHLTQTFIFVIAATGLYLAFRYRQLRRRDKRELERVVANETAMAETRDSLISSTVSVLRSDLQQLDELTARLQLQETKRPIQNAVNQLKDMFAKFTIAVQLRSSQSGYEREWLQLSALLERAQETVAQKASQRGVEIKLLQDTALSVHDPELLIYVLASVLDNAVAYSQEKGSVEVDIETFADVIRIGVIDYGSGMAPDELSLLMQPFTKLGQIEAFNHEGMGFSLYLDRLIMYYLDGNITLNSDPDRGTIVTLTLPNLLNEARVVSPQLTITEPAAI